MIYFQSVPIRPLEKYGPFVSVPQFLSPEECSKVVSYMQEVHEAKVHESGKRDLEIRSAKTSALPYSEETLWVFQKLEHAITQLNNDIYRFDIMGFREAIQLIRYDEGDHYSWHQDFANQHHSTRKLSVSVQLTDPSEYEGGELEFMQYGDAPKDQGAFVMFPSFQHHRVKPITKGTRHAMVVWVSGQPYR